MLNEGKIEELGCGVTRAWADGGSIPIFSIPNINRHTIDVWVDGVLAHLKTHPVEKPYLVLHDISAAGLALTPYVRSRSSELAVACAPYHGRLAAVISPGLISQLIGLFLKHDLRQKMHNVTPQTFTTHAEALAWLREGI